MIDLSIILIVLYGSVHHCKNTTHPILVLQSTILISKKEIFLTAH